MIFLEVVVAFAICLAFVAFGDVVSLITKAKIPALAASIIAYLIAIWFLGMPKEFPDVSGLAAIGNTFFIIFVAATATSVTPITMIREWRFLVIGLISVCTGMLFTIGIGGLLFDPREMFAGAMTTCGMGFTGGMMALNDRLKLRSMVVGEKDDMVYIASEECAMRVIEPNLDNIWSPRGGEPVIVRLDKQAMKEIGGEE